MIRVVLAFPNGEREEVLLADVPRKGDAIRRHGNGEALPLVVEHVLWEEGHDDPPNPQVLLTVRHAAEVPRG